MRSSNTLAAAVAALGLLLLAAPAHALPSIRRVTIETHDEVPLAATLVLPDGPGPHPAVVFTGSWGQHNLEYLVPALRLASRGYVVVAYTARGFFDSGGEVTVAGPDDVQDLSSVIDWLIANTSTDPQRIGASGLSYAAGIGLLASSFDERIRAVVALSGWSDLVYSLYINETRGRQSVAFLLGLSDLFGRASPEMETVMDDFHANRNVPQMIEYGRIRGAGTYLEGINAHRPAILLASAWGETIFPINQLVAFFGGLTGPKRWELRPGDHAIPEIPGLAGVDNPAWSSLERWFDHHLRGVDNGIDREAAVVLTPRSRASDESYPSWPEISSSRMRLHLGASTGRDGRLQSQAHGQAWRHTIAAGVDTPANAGTCLISGGVEAIIGVPPLAWLPLIDRRHAAVWLGDALTAPARVRGAAHLTMTVAPGGSEQTSVFAYLYDVDAWGLGRLITYLPYTLRGKAAGQPVRIDHDFMITAYDVPAGHRLALVVDTVDPLYLDAAPADSTVELSSRVDDAAVIELPLR